MVCPKCQGRRKQLVTVVDIRDKIWHLRIDCEYCGMTGYVTQAQFLQIESEKVKWCDCGAPDGVSSDKVVGEFRKWTCNKCKKLIHLAKA